MHLIRIFNGGVTIASLWDSGRIPSYSDALYIRVTNGNNSGRNSLRIVAGIGSSVQDFDAADWMTFSTAWDVHCSNSANHAASRSRYDSPGEPPVVRRMASIFSLKNSCNVWADGEVSFLRASPEPILWMTSYARAYKADWRIQIGILSCMHFH